MGSDRNKNELRPLAGQTPPSHGHYDLRDPINLESPLRLLGDWHSWAGLSERPEWQLAILGLILAILQTPVYFLLGQLSFVDMAFASITVLQMLAHLFSTSTAISFTNCLTQLFFILLVDPMEGYLLAAMAYDRYVAVRDPLHYVTLVIRGLCLRIIVGLGLVVLWSALLNTVLMAHLTFCSCRILQFFCNITPMLQLSCSRPFLNEMLIFTEGTDIILGPFHFILASCARIGAAVLCLCSAAGLCKATSTFGSHVLVVTLFYGPGMHMYMRPAGSASEGRKRQVAIFYTLVTPMLNPLIYSLRNHEFQGALRRLTSKRAAASIKRLVSLTRFPDREATREHSITDNFYLGNYVC
ncbi:olfactory receptor 1361-like [Tachyglossus aculeatus]|uniref:olfactory receptor 1361-like n=1 Tax=Tachyglossus aculeatus TaxID=9261 RepID=UPI0018F63279|nr:olfactory receptor 1361-like [Tachyglossus aculeatus]